MADFSQSFNKIVEGLYALQNQMIVEFSQLNNRVSILEEQHTKDNEFYDNLEALIQRRRNL